MLLDILHETTYDYVPPVKTALHMAHLRPAETATQRLLAHRLEVTPEPSRLREVTDVYGNTRAFFSLEIVHRSLVVRAEAIERAQRDEAGKLTLSLRRRPERLSVSRMYAHLFKGL